MPSTTTRQRRVIHLDGYYPSTPDASFARFCRELRRFSGTWGLTATAERGATGEHRADWRVTTRGADWASTTDYTLFRWDDLILADRSRDWPERVSLSVLSFADFIAGGAFVRYLRVAWRYALFFLYPFLWLFGLAALCVIGTRWGFRLAGHGDSLMSLPVAALAFSLLLPLVSRLAFLDHLFDDWIYARRMVRHGDGAVTARLDRLAAELAAEDCELLIVGHSFGAVHALHLIRALRAIRPDGPPIRFASVGSSILKVALHRAAHPLRETLAAVAALPGVIWCDFTALNDVMNFHRREPISTLGLPGRPARVENVRFRQMVAPEFYKKMERNFFRLHSQFISGNDRRARYDYFMMCLGPFTLEALAESPDGPVNWIDASGGLTDSGRRAAAPPPTRGSETP